MIIHRRRLSFSPATHGHICLSYIFITKAAFFFLRNPLNTARCGSGQFFNFIINLLKLIMSAVMYRCAPNEGHVMTVIHILSMNLNGIWIYNLCHIFSFNFALITAVAQTCGDKNRISGEELSSESQNERTQCAQFMMCFLLAGSSLRTQT